jgi:hypothetical protein
MAEPSRRPLTGESARSRLPHVILKSFSREVEIPPGKCSGFRSPPRRVPGGQGRDRRLADRPDGTYRSHADRVRLMDLNLTAEAVRFCDELHARLRDTYQRPA